jgi:hypothetical protein
LLGQAVDALEHAVDVRPGAGLFDLRLKLLDRDSRRLVCVFEPPLQLASQVRRDSVLRLLEGAPAGAHRSSHETGSS